MVLLVDSRRLSADDEEEEVELTDDEDTEEDECAPIRPNGGRLRSGTGNRTVFRDPSL